MPSILDFPEVRQRVSKTSVAEYHKQDEFNGNGKRTELIRGIVIEKISKSPLHRQLAMRLFRLIAGLVPKGYFVIKEEPLTFRDSEPEPDISVIGGREDDFVSRHPATAVLIVEVAVSSP